MNNCKKYKARSQPGHDHHRQPKADCQNCVYFSQANCGSHTNEGIETAGFVN